METVAMVWTSERMATLESMWTAGSSSGEIARHLGGVSRNAVMGKVDRMGLMRSADHNSRMKRTPFGACAPAGLDRSAAVVAAIPIVEVETVAQAEASLQIVPSATPPEAVQVASVVEDGSAQLRVQDEPAEIAAPAPPARLRPPSPS
jgi:GcrA cell cycle regulator